MLAVAATLAFASSASAELTRPYTGHSFGPDGTPASSFREVRSITVDQSTGDVYVYDAVAENIYKFDADGAPLDFSALGSNAIEGIGGALESGAVEQLAVAPPGSPGGTGGDIYVANNSTVKVYSQAGSELGTLGQGETCGVALDPAGHLLVGSFGETIREYVPTTNPPTEADQTSSGTVSIGLCNVAADGSGNIYASSFSGSVTAQLNGISDPGPTLIEPGGRTLAADPVSNELFLDEGDHVSAYGSNATPTYEFGAGNLTDSYGVAVNSSTDRIYAADSGTGTVKIFGPVTEVPMVTTEAASGLMFEGATLNGTVAPEGVQLQECVFEYGPAAEAELESRVPCSPSAGDIPPQSSPQAVTAILTGLRPNTSYRFRLTASAGGIETSGDEFEFSTFGPPRITEVLSSADQDTATLEATIDPHGAKTSYRVEAGPSESYGDVVAAGTVEAGEGPARISGRLTGLAPATTYHYRVVATNDGGGQSTSPDQEVETLNSCGYTDGRCLELVSRADKGPLAGPGALLLAGQAIQFQAAPAGSAFAYTVPYGYPDATAGDAAVYLSRRGVEGWSSEQINPPTSEPPIGAGAIAVNSKVKVLSSDLGCGVVSSLAPLAAGAPPTVVEAGGGNLYRRDDATGSYQLITYLPPVGPPTEEEVALKGAFTSVEYQVVGMSPDCERIVFRTMYRYPGIPAVGVEGQLYEWDHGTLRNVALIPGPGGAGEPVPAEALPGGLDEVPSSSNPTPLGQKEATNYWRAVASDGSRSVFTAVSRFGGDSGQRALFLRDADEPGVRAGTQPATDISRSETATPNDSNSRYWIASADGSRIFFTARYGLAGNGSSAGAISCADAPNGDAAESSGQGCDLYEYDSAAAAGSRLTDLSPDVADPKGAGVIGVLDASEDGSYVYFAARGRLGGAGKTEVENLSAGSYNIYLVHEGAIRYVHAIGEAEVLSGNALITTSVTHSWTSRSTTDGGRFAFESSFGVPGEVEMVYLYSAADGSTVCVSCRHDGQPPFSEHRLAVALSESRDSNSENRNVRPTVLTNNGRLYFYSFDPLAPGAIEGARNLYQWEHGQLSLIATEPVGVPRSLGTPTASFFGGASADGVDVYFATPQKLVRSAGDGWNVYDARAGGGFPEPTAPPPCDAEVEGACSPGGPSPPVTASPSTSSFTGQANPVAKRHKKKNHQKKHHRQKHGKPRKHKKKAGHGRRGNDNRRAGK